jgi:hypothetical protein
VCIKTCGKKRLYLKLNEQLLGAGFIGFNAIFWPAEPVVRPAQHLLLVAPPISERVPADAAGFDHGQLSGPFSVS